MYHHHIDTRNEEETISKVYHKQKECPVKGDWVNLIEEDFKFIGERMNDDTIKNMSKNEYKVWVKKKVEEAAFKSYIEEKNVLSKLKDIKYEKLQTQQYLTSQVFTEEERTLLFALRSRCYEAKGNFKSMFKSNPNCRFGCNTNENQEHIFTQCEALKTESELNVNYNGIFDNVNQKKVLIVKQLKCF